ncbi:BTB-kelch protein [Parasponia andersonii]|uniref:BTB-kelch protein n=1 Tax=Parasponia andersonii TaxID=3476 RepID=A0A2P5CCE4_PARAD|nr:BTB-kelch protein [Parasponia andersonii]
MAPRRKGRRQCPKSTTGHKPQPTETLIPSLPNDVALNCLARVPRWHHPTLSHVSKPIRTVLSSPQFYAVRSLLNTTQNVLYLRLGSYSSWPAAWFTLHRRPDPNPSDGDNLFLVRVPQPPVHIAETALFAVVGPRIYVLGGFVNGGPSADVWAFDCRFHTWERGPSMRMARSAASAAAVLGGKIYVAGGGGPSSTDGGAHWVESLDPEIGLWETVPSPDEVRNKWVSDCTAVGGGVCFWVARDGFMFYPNARRWEVFKGEMQSGWNGQSCVVNGVLYCYTANGRLKGFDEKNGVWKEVNGVHKDLPNYMSGASMVDLGGRLVVVWGDNDLNGLGESLKGRKMEVRCAEIEVKKDGDGDFWGEVQWSEKVLVPEWLVERAPFFYHCLSVSI